MMIHLLIMFATFDVDIVSKVWTFIEHYRKNLLLWLHFICSTEPQIFKSKFKGWDDVIPVDYTRTSESVQRRGVDLKVRSVKTLLVNHSSLHKL